MPQPVAAKNAGPSRAEISRRYAAIRRAMAEHSLDALIICGNQYAGFEGAVRYVSGFEIVHRYAYVLLPRQGDLTLIFPAEARWIGDKSKPWVRNHVWPEVPGIWLRQHFLDHKWKRIGVYGLDCVMAVRDYRAMTESSLDANGRQSSSKPPFEIVPFDFEFDLARAVKSEEELTEIREAMDIVVAGFRELVNHYAPGKTEAEIMAPAVELYFARGAGPRMMNILLSGTRGEAEASFKVPGHRVVSPSDLLLYSLEITNAGGYWVEFSRALIRGNLSKRTQAMKAAYPEAMEAARLKLHPGALASDVHRAMAEVFTRHGFSLGHLTGHAIGTTMLEYPAIGARSDVELEENMVFSVHPQVVDQEGKVCLYTQDTFRVAPGGGENLCDVEWRLYRGGDA